MLLKNLGDAFASPLSFAIALISVSFSLLLSFWLPWLPILPSIFHGSCNGHLLQLSECIELLKCEVKKKMNDEGGRSRGTKVTEVFSATKTCARSRTFRSPR